jgi:UDP-N-acetylglucosamine 3-dehydrogenase
MTARIGLIGYGRWGRNIEQTLLSLGDVSIISIGRNSPLRSDLDGVLIASPSATHADLAIPYIRAGIATFIEKPMATSVADARRICESVSRSQAPVFVGHVQLFNPAFHALLALLPRLGAIRYVLFDGANRNPRQDSSVLWDWLPHDLSMAYQIFGKHPARVQAWKLTNTPTVQSAVSRFEYGSVSLVSTTTWLSAVRRRQMTIVAEQGTVVFDERAKQKLALYDNDGNACYPSYGGEMPLTSELRAFLHLISTGSADTSHVALGLAIAQAIEAAHQSIDNAGALAEIRT